MFWIGIDSEVNISVSGCTFRSPKAGATAIRYNNGSNTVGSGSVIVTDSSFDGYGRCVQVEQNGDDAVNTTVSSCTFSNISIRPLEINGGRQAVVTGNIFNNFVTGQHGNPILIYDGDSPTSTDQTVTLTDNTFNYGSSANIYPVVIGAGCKINEDITSPTITFDTDYPMAYRYMVLSRGVGYSGNHRNAVWGDAGIPYLLASDITITGTDASNKSSLTIKPGVTVCLGDGSGSDNLTVRGDLTAIGTAAKPIVFTKKAGVTYGSEIAVSNNLRGNVTLKHCVMDGLYRGIGVISPSTSSGLISLENCTVQNTQEPIVLNGHKVLVKNCALIRKGIWIDGGSYANSIMIEGCSITAEGDNSDFGVGIKSTKSVTLKNCLITGFGGCGVSIINNSYQTLADGAPLIENCTITGNGYGVVYSRDYSSAYGAFIKNSIIYGNTGLDLASKPYTYENKSNPVKIEDGSIAYSLIGDDGSNLQFISGYYDHSTLGKIRQIATNTYSNRITEDPLFADATSGDYHLKSAAGRWNGSTWVTDAVTSPCIDAGDPSSAYGNEPVPNGDCINLGCYGNTAEASKSAGGGTIDTTVRVDGNPSSNVDMGTAVTLTAIPTGIVSPSYQWYSNTAASSTEGNQILSATYANYQPSTSMVGTIYYYCVVNGVTSNVIGVTVTSAPPVTYTITATASTGGSISPKGAVTVTKGMNQTFAITPNSNYSIANVTVDGVSQGKNASYTFDNITANHTIAATFSYNGGGSGSDGSGSGGSGSSGSSSGNVSPIIVTSPASDKPNSPTQGEIMVPGIVDGKGNITVNITDKTVTDAFDKALADTRKNDNQQNGITVILRVDTDSKTSSNITINLPKTVQDIIIAKKIVNTILVVDNPDIRIGMDLATVQEINRQAKLDVSITATRMDSSKLTGEARTAIGGRPVFDLKVNYGSGKAVSSFGAGSVSVTIPYTLGANEKASNVQAVYVDESGKIQWLISSVYESLNRVLRFSTNHFSTYGVGYKQDAPTFTDIGSHWAKDDIGFVVNRGLFSGTSKIIFSPNTAMTRGMFVTALGRLANADVSTYAKSSFTDVKNDAYYMGYIEWASKNNIVKGIGGGKFAPDQIITREQLAVIMSNYAKTIGFTLPKVHAENAFMDNAKFSAYAKDAVKQMQMAGVISGKNENLFDPQGMATRAEVSAVLRRFVELERLNNKSRFSLIHTGDVLSVPEK